MSKAESHAPHLLTPADHNDQVGGMRHVYPVVSRRAGGVSIGVNLNPNRACNYRCLYCQVPGLQRGKAPTADLALLRRELDTMLAWVLHGDFYQRHVGEALRALKDIAFSGDGEPTSAPNFADAVSTVRAARDAAGLPELPLVLITNGTLTHLPRVRVGLEALSAAGGEVWFKLDGGGDADLRFANDSDVGLERLRSNLRSTAALAPTWVQTCAFGWDGEAPGEAWRTAWLQVLREEVAAGTPLRGVLLYSVARPSHQPEAPRLLRLDAAWLEALADEVRSLGLVCRATP